MMQMTDIITMPELKDICNIPLPSSIPFGFNKLTSNRLEHYHLWVRMLYSCLVDADFLDTERFMNPEQFKLRCNYESLGELKNRFDRYMNEKTAHAKSSKINEVRAAILKSCREKAHLKSGFFSLNVPTGGGKKNSKANLWEYVNTTHATIPSTDAPPSLVVPSTTRWGDQRPSLTPISYHHDHRA